MAVVNRLQSLRIAKVKGKRIALIGYDVKQYEQFYYFDGALNVVSFDFHEYKNGINVFIESVACSLINMDVIVILYSDELNDVYTNLLRVALRNLTPTALLCVDFPKHNNWILGVKERQKRVFSLLSTFAKKAINSEGKAITSKYNGSCVYHVQVKKNYVFLLSGAPGSGKSTLASSCFSSETTPLVSGDRTYKEIFEGKVQINEPAKTIIQQEFKVNRIYRLTHRLFESKLEGDLVDCWVNLANKRSFILDSCIPKEFLPLIEDEFKARGYIPVNLTWDSEPTMEVEDLTNKKVNQFVKYMTKGSSLLRGLLKKK